MKSLSIIVLLSLFIVSCGPPKKEIAQAACSEILATRNFEDSKRVLILAAFILLNLLCLGRHKDKFIS